MDFYNFISSVGLGALVVAIFVGAVILFANFPIIIIIVLAVAIFWWIGDGIKY